MSYPSFLYIEEENLRPIDISVFADLQLLNFFSHESLEAALIPCREKNIIARRKLLLSLEALPARQKLKELHETTKQIKEYTDLYNKSKTEQERAASFVALTSEYCLFSRSMSEFDLGDDITSRVSDFFKEHIQSDAFIRMEEELYELPMKDISTFNVLIHKSNVSVSKSEGESYLSEILLSANELGITNVDISQNTPRRIASELISADSKLYPNEFSVLLEYYKNHSKGFDFSVINYEREFLFCLKTLDFLGKIRESNIPLSYADFSSTRKISACQAYDVSLIAKGTKEIIPNDINFTDDEPFYFLTGANGGGKTTYLRTVGITVILNLLGCPVPCLNAEIGCITAIYTHFPRDERFDGSGRFVEENNRVNYILDNSDAGSLILLNETYSTTNEENAIKMTEELANKLWNNRNFGLYITHQHSLSESEIPYLNVLIDRGDTNKRTYKIVRKKDTGGSFADDILAKYGLTDEALRIRFGELEDI